MRVIPALISLEPGRPLTGMVLYQGMLQSCSAQTKPCLFPLEVLNPCPGCPEQTQPIPSRIRAGGRAPAAPANTSTGEAGSSSPDR